MVEHLQLKTVTPAQSNGQKAAGSTSGEIETTASVRSVTYSAYPPSRVTPLTGKGCISVLSEEDGVGRILTLFLVAHLEQPALTRLAGPCRITCSAGGSSSFVQRWFPTVMASVPRRADSVTLFPALLGIWDGDDITNDFMTCSCQKASNATPDDCLPGVMGNEFPNKPCWTALSEWQTPQASTLTKIFRRRGQPSVD
jgi:hypothetical protein